MDDVAVILDADAQRYRAMMECDFDALDRLLADDLSYTHSTALCDDKPAYLAALASGRYQYLDVQTSDLAVKVYGRAAVMHGRSRFMAVVDGNERILNSRFLSVWKNDGAGWRMAAWASTPIPSNR
jgi:ketosteroid isomerase-like protein